MAQLNLELLVHAGIVNAQTRIQCQLRAEPYVGGL